MTEAVPVDVVTFGETLVSFRGHLASGAPLTTHVAGAESNVAIGLARLGHRVRWISRLGNDPFGDLVLRELRAESVDVSVVERDDTRPTGVMFALAAPGGRVAVQYRRAGSAASGLSPELVGAGFDPAGLDPAPRALHVTGITPALSASALATTRSAVELARQRGVRVSLDLNHRAALWPADAAGPVLADLARRAHAVIGSEDEVALLDPDAPNTYARANALIEAGVEEVVVKRGAKGASCFTRNRRTDVAAVVVPVVDVIGAGDAFCAGYLSGWLDGLPVGARLARGAALGAAAVASSGDWEGLPTRTELSGLTGADVVR